MEQPSFLVLGSDGFIGKYIYKRLMQDGLQVTATSRRCKPKDSRIIFDILNNDINNVFKDRDSDFRPTVIFGIAASNINFCKKNYDAAYQINVVKTKDTIMKLAQRGCKVIWFSSDNVFDGKKGNYTEDDVTCPINCYGRMKAEMEAWIIDNIFDACVLRLAKVVDDMPSNQNVFSEWQRQIDNNETIRCIRGNKLNFITVEDVYQTCLKVENMDLSGLYNCCGDVAYSRMELASVFRDNYKPDFDKIIECDASEFEFADARPLNLSMDNSKLKTYTQIHFSNIEVITKQYLEILAINLN